MFGSKDQPLIDATSDALKEQARKEWADKCWAVFVEYHDNSAWAKNIADEGRSGKRAPLTHEAVQYMQQEIDGRAARKAAFEKWNQEFSNEKPKTEPVSSDADGQRDSGAADLGGPEHNPPADS